MAPVKASVSRNAGQFGLPFFLVEDGLHGTCQIHRNSLPIANYREDIISTLERAQILVLCGETGW